MKARAAQISNRRRPHWWSALLSLFVALMLIAPASQLCALMETLPGHSHAAASGHSHTDEATAHHDHHHDAAAHHNAGHHSDGTAWQSVPEQHACCSHLDAPSVVAAASSRFAAPDASSIGLSFVPATLPAAQDIFALTNCRGRDGPSDSQPLPQLSRASLLGRAPPFSV